MGIDLHHHQRPEHQSQSKVTGADGRGYTRRGTKTKRSAADQLIAAGAPLILELYSTGQFEWFDGAEARSQWEEVREFVISTTPTSKQLSKHEHWNAGVWEAEDGTQVLHLTGFC